MAMKENLRVNLCTGFGTLLAILPQLDAADLLKTVILAIVGTLASFLASLVLQRLFRKK